MSTRDLGHLKNELAVMNDSSAVAADRIKAARAVMAAIVKSGSDAPSPTPSSVVSDGPLG